MNNILKTIAILAIVIITLINTLLKIDNQIIFILEIIFSSVFLFFIGRESKRENKIFKYIFMFLFWNITYLVIKNGIFISNDKLLNIFIDSILLKDIYLDILPVIAYGHIISLFNKDIKSISIIFQIVLVMLSIYLKNIIFFYFAIFLFGRLFDNRKKLNINIKFFDLLNEFNLGIYIFHKLILEIIIYFNIAKYNNISDLFGSLIIIYIISLMIGYNFINLPVIRNLIKE